MSRLTVWMLLLFCCASAWADERILSFHSDIEIAADSTMAVTETIRVRAEGNRIQRGIYRDFPTSYVDRYGNRVNVLFEPTDVRRDGKPEKWHTERLSNGMRVYFGDAEVWLGSGEFTYEFRYRTARQLGYFEDHDELYWNVTGNGWDFSIDAASAAITLPGNPPRDRISIEGYTGAQGSKAQNYTTKVEEDGRAFIAASRALPPQNGLTVVVGFPKGLVTRPDLGQSLHWFALDNRREAVLVLGLLLLTGFLYMQWRRVGRDPKGGVVIPQYDPPAGLSPAAARFIRNMGYDDRCFAADMVELGVRGAVTINNSGKKDFSVQRAGALAADIPDSARTLYAGLLGSQVALDFKQSNHTIIGAARKDHEKFLDTAHAKANFQRNDGIGCLGFLIALAAVVAALLIDGNSMVAPILIPLVATAILCGLATSAVMSFVKARADGRPGYAGAIGSLIALALALTAALFLARSTSVLFALLTALIFVVQVPFAKWMRAPTVAGRALLDRIEGLRLYLGVAERDDLARAQAPPMNVDEYQRLLPYALALDVEKTWGDRLAAAIGPAAVAAAAAGMAWYHGSNQDGFDASSFGSSLGSSLSSAISSSASPPGSSSGGGGGGSSGGGGGGGGGGGW